MSLGALNTGDSLGSDRAPSPSVTAHSIGFVLTHRKWAVYKTPDQKEECPHGLNVGEREHFKFLYPDDGTQRTLVDTQLKWEGNTWLPTTTPEPYPYREVEGKIGLGLNLDGRVGPNDFTSPDGEKGIDNQLYRAIGCLAGYNQPAPYITFYEESQVRRDVYSRQLIEITGVDNLVNDDDVTVTTYRGMDPLLASAAGEDYLPGGTQRIDERWGKEFVSTFKGRIKDGVLTTRPADFRMSLSIDGSTGEYLIRNAVFRLKLTPDHAEGYIGGYVDVRSWYLQFITGWTTHHANYGQVSAPSLWRSLERLADAFPDKNGQNTAISAALDVKFAQVYIVHAEKATADNGTAPRPTGIDR